MKHRTHPSLPVLSILLLSLALLFTPASALEDEAEERWTEIKGGLKYIDLEVGDGDEVRPGRRANVHYTGYLSNGSKFQSSKDSGKSFVFEVGGGQVVKGWDLGVRGMREGGTRKLYIPAKMAYGRRGVKVPGGDKDQWVIPPNEDLVFEVEVINVSP